MAPPTVVTSSNNSNTEAADLKLKEEAKAANPGAKEKQELDTPSTHHAVKSVFDQAREETLPTESFHAKREKGDELAESKRVAKGGQAVGAIPVAGGPGSEKTASQELRIAKEFQKTDNRVGYMVDDSSNQNHTSAADQELKDAKEAQKRDIRIAYMVDESSNQNHTRTSEADQELKDAKEAQKRDLRIGYMVDESSNQNHGTPLKVTASEQALLDAKDAQRRSNLVGYMVDESSRQSHTPGATSLRRNNPNPAVAQPGAMAVAGLNGRADSFDADPSYGVQPEESPLPPPDDDAGLVSAKPVMDESLRRANEVGKDTLEEEEKKRMELQAASKRKYVQLGFLGLSFLIVLAAIGVVVGRRLKNEDDSTAAPTMVPSESPTGAPTGAPTPYLLDFPDYTRRALDNPDSPQSKAYQWLLQDPNLDSYPAWRQLQRFALVTLFYSTNGATAWERNDDWLSYNVSECEWLAKGNMRLQLMDIVGTFSERLINLYLGWYRYNPYESFADFWEGGDEVGFYDLPCGASPEQEAADPEAHFRYRRFWLQNNMLDGILPDEIGLLTSLEDWGMAHNPSLRGTLPTTIGNLQKLQFMGIEDCGFQTFLPTEIGRLTDLRTMSMVAQPGLKGKVPSEIGLLSNRLMYFDVPITEPLPSEMGLLTNLEYFSPQSSTAGMGSIPSEFGLLTKLRLMHIMDSPEVGGTIPSELGRLSLLEMLQIRGTSVSGTIPATLGNLSFVKVLLMDHNSLTGSLPSRWDGMTNVEELVLEGNPLEGPLPNSTAWSNLGLLLLEDTLLTGTIAESHCSFAQFDCWDSLCGCNCTCSA